MAWPVPDPVPLTPFRPPDPLPRRPRLPTSRRRFLARIGAAAAAGAVGAAAGPSLPAAAVPDYGSGQPGDWQPLPSRISPDSILAVVRDDPDGLLAVGDSVLYQAGTPLAQMHVGHGGNFAINAWSGRPTPPAVDWLAGVKARGLFPPRLLMCTGNNDIWSPLGFEPQLHRVMELADGRPVRWYTLSVDRWGVPLRSEDAANVGLINRALYLAAGRYSNLELVDWFHFIRSAANTCHPAGYPQIVTTARSCDRKSDGTHLTPYGVSGWVYLAERALWQ